MSIVLALLAACLQEPLRAADAPATQPPPPPPGIERVDLFQAGAGGYFTYRIPGLIVTSKGTVLAYCEARHGYGLDWDPIDVLLRRSVDGGRTWEPARAIAIAPPDARDNPVAIAKHLGGKGVTLNNPMMIAAPDAIHFLYCVNYGRLFYASSHDDGVTFSTPVEITSVPDRFRSQYDWKVIGPGPGHGIRLKRGPHAGRMIVPIWLSTSTGNNAHHPSAVATIYCDDSTGKTWACGDIVARPTADVPDPNETSLAELSDGRVMLNIRNESTRHRRLISTSPDGATQWSAPSLDETLFEPICFASLATSSDPASPTGQWLLFANPDSSAAPAKGLMRPRKNLTLRRSGDDGKTWLWAKVLDPGSAGYNDLAVLPDGTLLCLYEHGSRKDMFDTARLSILRIPKTWYAGAE